MNKTTVNVELVICGGSFEPDMVTKTLNLAPTDMWKKGDLVPKRRIVRDHSEWSLETGRKESCDISDQSDELLSILK